MSDDKLREQVNQISSAVDRVDLQTDEIAAWLNQELGYGSGDQIGGAWGRRLLQVEIAVQECRDVLRGKGNELGLMQRVAMLWWSFPIVVSICSTAIGTAVGYALGWIGAK
ncbi:MAG: hypothetical protein AAF961_14410 [Planctomycetota bacterium]